jgi:hypothetical protein
MPELSHYCGQDLAVGPTGDLALVSGVTETTQRIIRRLLTNKGEYLWHLLYGAGLPAQVGLSANAMAIQSLIRGEIFKEQTVAQVPAPTINVTASPGSNTVTVNIAYTSSVTGLLVIIPPFTV